jgi:hypothetical protein
LFEAWARLGQALARRAPLVLLVDDLQWADATSLDVLRYAARRWVQVKVPVLLVVALRSEVVASTPALTEWLAGLRRDLDVAELDLGPLAFDDAVRLLRSLRPTAGRDPGFEGFARWIFAETGGQPFFLVETLRALAERGVLVPRRDEKGAWVVDAFAAPDRDNRVGFLPEGVRRVVQARLAPLHPVARDLLARPPCSAKGFGSNGSARSGGSGRGGTAGAGHRGRGPVAPRSRGRRGADLGQARTRFAHDKSATSSTPRPARRGGASCTVAPSKSWSGRVHLPRS